MDIPHGKRINITILVITVLLLSGCAASDDAQQSYDDLISNLPGYENRHNLYFVDAHSQLPLASLESTIINDMRYNYVCRTLLSGRRDGTPEVIAEMAERHPRQLTAAVRIKGKHYNNNNLVLFNAYLLGQVASGRYDAMGEVLIYHAHKDLASGDAPEIKVRFTDPRIDLVTQAARQYGWPVVLHIEFASADLSAADRQAFMQGLESYLASNRDLHIVLNQMAMLPYTDVQRLINSHPNVYFTTAQTNPVRVLNSNQPWVNLFSGYTLKMEWKRLFISHPDRFIFALDNVQGKHWREYYSLEMRFWMSAMNDLPPDVAHMISHGNSERLWHLRPDPGCLRWQIHLP